MENGFLMSYPSWELLTQVFVVLMAQYVQVIHNLGLIMQMETLKMAEITFILVVGNELNKDRIWYSMANYSG